MTELETLQAELQWAIAANAEHQRTRIVLEWAADFIEELATVGKDEGVTA